MDLRYVAAKDRTQPGLSFCDQLRYAGCEARILALRARLERDVELSEERYVLQHPAWLRLKETILEVLRPHPEIAKQLLVALTAPTASYDGAPHGEHTGRSL